jgi:hypothetical protein
MAKAQADETRAKRSDVSKAWIWQPGAGMIEALKLLAYFVRALF